MSVAILMGALTLVIAFTAFMSLLRAIEEKTFGHWVGFVFCLGCLAVAVWFTVNTYLGLAPGVLVG
jgi:hypothetical protein